ncbi:ERF family protein [Bradyrhizobium vignae]|uniref:ERF family protein n=1 Tax=Bradyrhizobium vignae TaxID=1549949 RepID=UPI001FE0FB32|nr:ERF family protein [Bradyrhizobium vignae]
MRPTGRCAPVAETAAPHRMGAALTYARRYALFTLVGIAGEDDLDAPNAVAAASDLTEPKILPAPRAKPVRAVLDRSPVLSETLSAELRERLLSQLGELADGDGLLVWAKTSLPLKSTLREADARLVEAAYRKRLDAAANTEFNSAQQEDALSGEQVLIKQQFGGDAGQARASEDETQQVGLAFPKEPPGKRSKAHLLFIREQRKPPVMLSITHIVDEF